MLTTISVSFECPFEGPVDDWNSFALGTLGLSQPINENTTFEATLSGYYADQQIVDRLDLGFIELSAGPRFTNDDGSLSFKPYGLVQGILLGGVPYQSAFGGGALLRWTYADGWWIEPQFEYKNRNYSNSTEYPSATDQTGDLYTYAVNLNGQIAEDLSWSSRLEFAQNDAAAKYQSYDQYSATLALEIGFDLLGVDNWLLTPFASASWTDFKGIAPPERYAHLTTKRRDEMWSVGANLEVPLRNGVAMGVSVEYTKNHSNLDRDKYEDFTVIIGPQGRF